MSTILTLVGVAMLALSVKDWLATKNLASLFSSIMPTFSKKTSTVASVVADWEVLYKTCVENNRLEAVAKLDELFPLLNKVSEPKKVV